MSVQDRNKYILELPFSVIVDIYLQSTHAKGVNTVPEAVPIWLAVQYISSTGQYQRIISGLPQFYIFNIYTHTHTQNLYLP